ncbi:MAG: DUF2007 domain-containing protein [Syntrophomonadaceae bacterium]
MRPWIGERGLETEHSPEYRTIAVFGSVADAELARGLLEADGIPVAVLDAMDAAIFPGAGRAVRVLVPSGDLPRARELLTTSASPAEEDDVAIAPERLTRSWALRWLVIALALAAIAAIVL